MGDRIENRRLSQIDALCQTYVLPKQAMAQAHQSGGHSLAHCSEHTSNLRC